MALIRDGYTDLSAARNFGAHEKPALNRLDLRHRVAGVNYKIEQHLLQLDLVTIH